DGSDLFHGIPRGEFDIHHIPGVPKEKEGFSCISPAHESFSN
ncbi:hypothetical protein CEXT_40751, partial [Caerostris extrusa]